MTDPKTMILTAAEAEAARQVYEKDDSPFLQVECEDLAAALADNPAEFLAALAELAPRLRRVNRAELETMAEYWNAALGWLRSELLRDGISPERWQHLQAEALAVGTLAFRLKAKELGQAPEWQGRGMVASEEGGEEVPARPARPDRPEIAHEVFDAPDAFMDLARFRALN
jgi:hypothetical protein